MDSGAETEATLLMMFTLERRELSGLGGGYGIERSVRLQL
jgi:hypothetical protein